MRLPRRIMDAHTVMSLPKAVSVKEKMNDSNYNRTLRSQGSVKGSFKKYFMEGQKLSTEQLIAMETLSADASLGERLLVNHRRLLGMLIPLAFFQTCWFSLAFRWNFFALFPQRYIMFVTMCVGSTVAGMTSEGGGAVAFPVMTLALGLTPAVARDFSLMCQSCGMTAAAFTIFWMKIQLEYHSIFLCSFGAVFGLIFGLEVIDSMLTSEEKKLCFVSIWFSFAFALYLLNRQHKRKTFDSIPNFGVWHAVLLICVGFIGGIFSAIAGSGVDICSFAVLCLLFRISEKVSTPTSVVLMAINTCVGFFWRHLMTDTGCEPEAWEYFKVAVPAAVFFAPFGSFLSSHFHRQVFAILIYVLDTVALVTAFAVLPMTFQLWLLSFGLIIGGFFLFFLVSKAGEKFLEIEEDKEMKEELDKVEAKIPV